MPQPQTAVPPVVHEMAVPETHAAATRRMMLLAAGEHLFALPLEQVREIFPAKPYTRLPGTTTAVCGLINVRGRIITVVDLAAFLGLTPARTDPEHSVVLLDYQGRRIGLAVRDILHILDVERGALDGSADTLRALGFDGAHIAGVGEVDGRVYVAIEPQEILRPLLSNNTRTLTTDRPEAG
jgi:purine-binding chemotaxis protein CheW